MVLHLSNRLTRSAPILEAHVKDAVAHRARLAVTVGGAGRAAATLQAAARVGFVDLVCRIIRLCWSAYLYVFARPFNQFTTTTTGRIRCRAETVLSTRMRPSGKTS